MDANSRILCFGEILWDLLEGKKLPGGAPMNVALHLNKMGLDVRLISRIGADRWGKEMEEYLKSTGFHNYLLQRDPYYPTGWAQVDMKGPNNPHYMFPDSAWDHLELDFNVKSSLQESDILVYGSLIARNCESRRTLMNMLNDSNIYRVFDMNLRQPNYTKDTVESLLQKADLLKVNEHELQVLTSWFFKPDSEANVLKRIRDRFKCSVITLTRGENGASVLYGEQYFTRPGYKVRVADTIGAGDAYLAGFLKGLLWNRDPESILSFACAAGAYVASRTGANPSYEQEEIHRIMYQQDH